MHRRAFLATAAALPTAGCIDALTRRRTPEPPDGRSSLAPDPGERARIVLVEVAEEGPTLTGVVVNFRDERIDVEVVAEFYEEVDGFRETYSHRTQALSGLDGKEGEQFSIPFPSVDSPGDVQYDLEVEVTAIFD